MPKSGQIAPTIPLEQAGEEKRELYGRLVDVGKEVQAEQPAEPIAKKRIVPAPREPESTVREFSDDDKERFVRAVLGDRAFSKSYRLFGSIEAEFEDRTARRTEDLYAQLSSDIDAGSISAESEDEWLIWVERYQLAANLTRIRTPGLAVKEYPSAETLLDRVRALLELPKPMFQAILQANRDFEDLVRGLTEHAQTPDFWPAGGSGSRSSPPSPELSTTQTTHRVARGGA